MRELLWLRLCRQVECRSGKRPLGHVQHLDDVAPPGPPHVGRLLRLPRHHARGQKQEEAREEDGEEHKEVDMELVLSEEDYAVRHLFVGVGRIEGLQDQVEPRRLQAVVFL